MMCSPSVEPKRGKTGLKRKVEIEQTLRLRDTVVDGGLLICGNCDNEKGRPSRDLFLNRYNMDQYY